MMRGMTNATQLSGDLLESSVILLNVHNAPQVSDTTPRFHMKAEVLTAVKMSIPVFWVVTPCELVGRYNAENEGGVFLHIPGMYLLYRMPLQHRRPTLTGYSLFNFLQNMVVNSQR
jgi:hypothetical protein